MMRLPLAAYWALLRRYLVAQRGAALLMVALLLASIAMQLVGPQLARRFIDAARAGASEGTLLLAALLFMAAALAQQALRVLATYWSERVAWTATNGLRADLADHLLRLDMSFHKAHPPGELIERVDGDVQALAGFFSSFVVQLLGSMLLLVGALVAFFLLNLWLGLAFTLFALFALLLLGYVHRRGAPFWQQDRERSADFYSYIGEAFGASEDLRALGALPYAMRRFYEQLRAWLPVVIRANLWGNWLWVSAALLFAVADGIAYGVGGWLFGSGSISLGAVYLVVAYTGMLAAPIETIRTQLQDLQQADAGIVRMQELFDTSSRLIDGNQDLPPGPLAVELRDVSFAYEDGDWGLGTGDWGEGDGDRDWGLGRGEGGEGDGDMDPQSKIQNPKSKIQNPNPPTLHAITLSLAPGRVLGLLGRTGSGKTTLARLLFRMYDPQAGEVLVGGVELRRARLASLRARVGLVTQDVQLFAASLRDNITFFDPTLPDERLLEVLGTLGLGPWLARLPAGLDSPLAPGQLSAGEAQLLALARVFVSDPGLVILDEASSRLDPATEALLERAISRLLAGRTAVIIAHRLATVERADDILILEGGQVAEYGPRAQLAANPSSHFATLRRAGLSVELG